MKLSLKKLLLLFCLSLPGYFSFAQSGEEFRVIELENSSAISSIEISPDKKILAISNSGSSIFFWDIESEKVTGKTELSGYSQGPYMNFSADGKYLLLLQQFYTDFRLNNDRPSRVQVLDIASGKVLFTKDAVHSACFAPDNKSIITAEDDAIIFRNIISGSEERKFKPANITNSVAINPRGDLIAVSQKPTEADLKNIPSVRDDKKAIKEAIKFREVTVFYDAKTFEKKLIVNDIFDIIFSMHFSADGNTLYLFNAPNTRLRASDGALRNGYIQSVNVADGQANRIIFPTSSTEPQYKESPDRKFFATTSVQQKFRVLNSVDVFERETGSTVKSFVNDFRLTEDVHTGRAAFEFLPDNKTIVLMYGSKLAFWKFQ